MDHQSGSPSSAELVPQTAATASPPIPISWLDVLECMQTLPGSQASSMAETHVPMAYPYLDALHQFPRRRAQNRASQRAYRERKEQRIRDLEQLLQEARRREETLTQAYLSLRTEYERVSDEQEDGSSMGTTTPVTGETIPARLDAAPMQQHSSDVVGGFNFSTNAYE
ncbi:hypothetical protein MAC_04322 [Metarhizium acridum CQMa 102]|uniref:Putative transcription factor kapC n=1 Tax=Metarhizium acridum (strain CQMa 102) TaxID=655827 RepID=E9E374_METAQ|nr:uncharacterized protein MAC_04322 [Metarhizium acridum CQMa 102]EFY89669.1 hypothetical protein MAC_04322 [Metarhizium acridum CQMa 102]